MKDLPLTIGTRIRFILAIAGGILTIFGLVLYQFFLVRTPLDPIRIDIPDPFSPFIAGAVSVWLFSTPLKCFPEPDQRLPPHPMAWIKRGMVAGILSCFLTGLLLSVRSDINGILDGRITIPAETVLAYLFAFAFEPLFFSFIGVVIMGIPALLAGALSGYIAERSIRSLFRLQSSQ